MVLILAVTGCQQLGDLVPVTSPSPTPAPAPTPTPGESPDDAPDLGVPPGPVIAVAPLPGGEFLAGVGPVGDAESRFEWRLYRGREATWRPLFWPPEAIPRQLHPIPNPDPASPGLLFALPFSNALFGRGQAWGLMRSTDGGRSWQQTLTGLGDPYVMDLAFAPGFTATPGDAQMEEPAASPAEPSPHAGNQTMFAVTWYSGVYRSIDAGATWEPLPLRGEAVEPSGGANPYDLAVAVSPDYAGPGGPGLVLASFSHGLHRRGPITPTWQTIPLTVTATMEDFDPPQAQLTAGKIVFSPTFAEDGTVYLISGYAGLFRSTDRGQTWQNAARRLPLPPPFVSDFQLAVASVDEAYLLLDSEETDPRLGQPVQVLYRTRDGGRSWEALEDPPTLGWVSALALSRDGEGRVVLHLGGSRGGVSSHLADSLAWD